MEGPVPSVPVEPRCLVQSKLSVLLWVQPHTPESKLQTKPAGMLAGAIVVETGAMVKDTDGVAC